MLAFALTLQSLELLTLWPRLRKIWRFSRAFQAMLWLRLAASLLLFFTAPQALIWFLLLTTIYTAMRFGGTLNGGSDYMTVVVLSSKLVPWGEVYLAVQLTLSYFVAGLVKVRQKEWRDGSALTTLTGLPAWMARPVLLWECTFPVVWLNHNLCLIYLAIGLVFHLVNARVLGLNRFFWIWLAAYPSLLGIQS
jgi:hypothetical protein